ncbi:MAG: hypothetical protein ACRDWY_18260, partial [Actinomycetes bacterium]
MGRGVLTAIDRSPGESPSRRDAAAAYVVPTVLAALVVLPLLPPGFVLSYDMVFTPRQPLRPESIGVGASLPRAVPVDAVVAAVETVLPGMLLQKLVLVAVLVGAGVGAARLGLRTAHGAGLPAGVVGAVTGAVYVWNPYVAERFVIGHWSLLVAYAVLPWTLSTAWDVRARTPGAPPRLVLLLAASAITPTGGLVAAFAAVIAVGRRRAALGVAFAAAVMNAPWVVAGALHPQAGTADPDGVAAFALRAESWLGVAGSALSLGGIWNAEVVPDSREGAAAAAVIALLLLALAAVGLSGWGRMSARSRWTLAVLAGAGLVLSLGSSLPGPDAVVRWAVTTVPGAGLLRDAHKWLVLLALPLALAVGWGAGRVAEALRARVTDPPERAAAVVGAGALAVLVAVATVPDLVWGVGGRLELVRYPQDWYDVRSALADVPADELVVVVPFQTFRAYPWNSGRTVLDPAPRWFRQDLVVDDDLPLRGTAVEGESRRAAVVERALAGPDPVGALTSRGVHWVLVERSTPGPVPPDLLRAGTVVT